MGPTAYALNVFSHTRHVFTHADFFFTSHDHIPNFSVFLSVMIRTEHIFFYLFALQNK